MLAETLRLKNIDIREFAEAVEVKLGYPEQAGNINTIEVALSDVRAANSIRIRYDFARNGWVISQQPAEQDEDDQSVLTPWAEVAFIDG